MHDKYSYEASLMALHDRDVIRDTVSETKRFNLHICAERPGLLSARDGFALNASGDFSLLAQADIVANRIK